MTRLTDALGEEIRKHSSFGNWVEENKNDDLLEELRKSGKAIYAKESSIEKMEMSFYTAINKMVTIFDREKAIMIKFKQTNSAIFSAPSVCYFNKWKDDGLIYIYKNTGAVFSSHTSDYAEKIDKSDFQPLTLDRLIRLIREYGDVENFRAFIQILFKNEEYPIVGRVVGDSGFAVPRIKINDLAGITDYIDYLSKAINEEVEKDDVDCSKISFTFITAYLLGQWYLHSAESMKGFLFQHIEEIADVANMTNSGNTRTVLNQKQLANLFRDFLVRCLPEYFSGIDQEDFQMLYKNHNIDLAMGSDELNKQILTDKTKLIYGRTKGIKKIGKKFSPLAKSLDDFGYRRIDSKQELIQMYLAIDKKYCTDCKIIEGLAKDVNAGKSILICSNSSGNDIIAEIGIRTRKKEKEYYLKTIFPNNRYKTSTEDFIKKINHTLKMRGKL